MKCDTCLFDATRLPSMTCPLITRLFSFCTIARGIRTLGAIQGRALHPGENTAALHFWINRIENHIQHPQVMLQEMCHVSPFAHVLYLFSFYLCIVFFLLSLLVSSSSFFFSYRPLTIQSQPHTPTPFHLKSLLLFFFFFIRSSLCLRSGEALGPKKHLNTTTTIEHTTYPHKKEAGYLPRRGLPVSWTRVDQALSSHDIRLEEPDCLVCLFPSFAFFSLSFLCRD